MNNSDLKTQKINLPYATVSGEPFCELPKDLYIPPDAMEVFLDAFTGPLDLLLYLIKKQNIDILNIPIAQITTQYVEYINLMKSLQLELAGEYLLMAAMLAEIKSRMLLPRPVSTENEEADPRAELVRRLREYERYKKAAEDMDILPRMQRELFHVTPAVPEVKTIRPLPTFTLQELLSAFKDVLARAEMYTHHHVSGEALSVRDRMTQILASLQTHEFVSFESMFNINEGRVGVVVTFMAMLELLRQNLLDIVQADNYGSIYIKNAEMTCPK